MDIHQLRTILNVAELGSLSRAAERLRIAQPALSRQVRLLEQELGVPLFARHGRGMVPTEQGQQILHHARRIMEEMEDIRAVADPQAEVELHGLVAIGMPPTVAQILAVPLVSCCQQSQPKATVRLVSSYSAYLMDLLSWGAIDAAILYDTQALGALRTTPLLEEDLCLIGAPQRRLRPDRPVPVRDLAGLPLALSGQGHGMRATVEAAARSAGIELTVPIEVEGFDSLKDLVRHDMCLTILPQAAVRQELEKGELHYAPLIEPRMRWRLVIAVAADKPQTQLGRFLVRSVDETARRLVTEGLWPARLQ